MAGGGLMEVQAAPLRCLLAEFLVDTPRDSQLP